jgi:hypothetical protein
MDGATIAELPNAKRGRKKMEFYLSDQFARQFTGGTDEPVGNFTTITHDCPFCGKRASEGRSLVWIAGECLEKDQGVFPCANCSQRILVPSTIFPEEGLKKLKTLRRADLFRAIGQMSLRELLVPNWGEVIFTANKGGPVDPKSLKWDGKGTCPGCGKAQAEELSQGLKCFKCQTVFWVNQNNISHTGNTIALCSKCGNSMVIPPTVWCPVCGRNLQSETVILKLFREANEVPPSG